MFFELVCVFPLQYKRCNTSVVAEYQLSFVVANGALWGCFWFTCFFVTLGGCSGPLGNIPVLEKEKKEEYNRP